MRRGTLRLVFTELQHGADADTLLGTLDVLSTLVEHRPEVVSGCELLLGLLLNMVEHVERSRDAMDDEVRRTVQGKLLRLVGVLGRKHVSVRDVHAVLQLFQQVASGEASRSLSPLLLNAMCEMTGGDGPSSRFEFSGVEAALIIPRLQSRGWPFANGYSFCTWLRFENESLTNDRYIFSMLSAHGLGVNLVIRKQTGELMFHLITPDRRQRLVIPRKVIDLVPRRWYFVCVTHSRAAAFSRSQGSCRIYIDSALRFQGELTYPQFEEPLTFCAVGANTLVKGLATTSSFLGQMGTIYMFKTPITAEQVGSLFARGPDHSIRSALNLPDSGGWLKSVASFFGASAPKSAKSKDNEHFRGMLTNLFFLFHPKCVDRGICSDTSVLHTVGTREHQALHASISAGVRVSVKQGISDVIHCAVGGIACVIPLFQNLPKLSAQPASPDSSLLPLLFTTLGRILCSSVTVQRSMLDLHGFSMMGLLLSDNAPPEHLTLATVAATAELCRLTSWMELSERPPSYDVDGSNSEEDINMMSNNMRSGWKTNLNLAPEIALRRTLFNDSFSYLLLNFRLWMRRRVPLAVQCELLRIVNSHVQRNPRYFYQLIKPQRLLDNMRRYLSYLPSEVEAAFVDPEQLIVDVEHLRTLRALLLTMLRMLVLRGCATVEGADVESIVRAAAECPDPLQVGEYLDFLSELLQNEPQVVLPLLMRYGGSATFLSILHSPVGRYEFVQVPALHLVAHMIQHAGQSPVAVSTLLSAVETTLTGVPFWHGTYLALVEIVLSASPGSLSPQNTVDLFVRGGPDAHDDDDEDDAEPHHRAALKVKRIMYPYGLHVALRLSHQPSSQVSFLNTVEDLRTLVAGHKDNAGQILLFGVWQQALIELLWAPAIPRIDFPTGPAKLVARRDSPESNNVAPAASAASPSSLNVEEDHDLRRLSIENYFAAQDPEQAENEVELVEDRSLDPQAMDERILAHNDALLKILEMLMAHALIYLKDGWRSAQDTCGLLRFVADQRDVSETDFREVRSKMLIAVLQDLTDRAQDRRWRTRVMHNKRSVLETNMVLFVDLLEDVIYFDPGNWRRSFKFRMVSDQTGTLQLQSQSLSSSRASSHQGSPRRHYSADTPGAAHRARYRSTGSPYPLSGRATPGEPVSPNHHAVDMDAAMESATISTFPEEEAAEENDEEAAEDAQDRDGSVSPDPFADLPREPSQPLDEPAPRDNGTGTDEDADDDRDDDDDDDDDENDTEDDPEDADASSGSLLAGPEGVLVSPRSDFNSPLGSNGSLEVISGPGTPQSGGARSRKGSHNSWVLFEESDNFSVQSINSSLSPLSADMMATPVNFPDSQSFDSAATEKRYTDMTKEWPLVETLLQCVSSLGMSLKPQLEIQLHGLASSGFLDMFRDRQGPRARAGGPVRVVLRMLLDCVHDASLCQQAHAANASELCVRMLDTLAITMDSLYFDYQQKPSARPPGRQPHPPSKPVPPSQAQARERVAWKNRFLLLALQRLVAIRSKCKTTAEALLADAAAGSAALQLEDEMSASERAENMLQCAEQIRACIEPMVRKLKPFCVVRLDRFRSLFDLLDSTMQTSGAPHPPPQPVGAQILEAQLDLPGIDDDMAPAASAAAGTGSSSSPQRYSAREQRRQLISFFNAHVTSKRDFVIVPLSVSAEDRFLVDAPDTLHVLENTPIPAQLDRLALSDVGNTLRAMYRLQRPFAQGYIARSKKNGTVLRDRLLRQSGLRSQGATYVKRAVQGVQQVCMKETNRRVVSDVASKQTWRRIEQRWRETSESYGIFSELSPWASANATPRTFWELAPTEDRYRMRRKLRRFRFGTDHLDASSEPDDEDGATSAPLSASELTTSSSGRQLRRRSFMGTGGEEQEEEALKRSMRSIRRLSLTDLAKEDVDRLNRLDVDLPEELELPSGRHPHRRASTGGGGLPRSTSAASSLSDGAHRSSGSGSGSSQRPRGVTSADTAGGKPQHRVQRAKAEDSGDWDLCDPSYASPGVAAGTFEFSSSRCELVLPIGTVSGRLDIGRKVIRFTYIPRSSSGVGLKTPSPGYDGDESDGEGGQRPRSSSMDDVYGAERPDVYALPQLERMRRSARHDYYWPMSDLQAVYRRRHALRRTAIELFLLSGTNFFINFESRQERAAVLRKILQLRPPNLHPACSRRPSELLSVSGVTAEWQQRKMSNFEYLMYVNTISGRTFNDLNQYPVFPWVLKLWEKPDNLPADFDILDVIMARDPDTHPYTHLVFRDLSKPIGALNPERLERVLNRFGTMSDPDIPPFHYGSHYSNAGIVLFYLIRLEAFASLHIELQAGRFDFPDRLFGSVAQTWANCMESLSCFKELIPEFFYLPEMFENVNGFRFGHKQDGTEVDAVKLPWWANDAEHFVNIHRLALESEYVSRHLHQWIDLIFGFKQRGPAALEAHNIFYHLTYEGGVDRSKIDDPIMLQAVEAQIRQFGQTPLQLFKEPHPQRQALTGLVLTGAADAFVRVARMVAPLPPNIASNAQAPLHAATFSPDCPVLVISPCREEFFTVSAGFLLASHRWTVSRTKSADSSASHMSFSLSHYYSALTPFSHPHPPLPRALAFTKSGNLMFLGNNWDDSVHVFAVSSRLNQDTEKREVHLRLTQYLLRHKARVSCVAVDRNGKTLVTGSRDCTLLLWDVATKSGASTVRAKPTADVLRGHRDEVLCVAIDTELDVCVSTSTRGVCLLHSTQSGAFLREVHLPGGGVPHHLLVSPNGSIVSYAHQLSQGRPVRRVLSRCTINGLYGKQVPLEASITAMTLAHYGSMLVTGDEAGQVLVRRISDLQVVQRCANLGSSVSSLRLDPHERFIFVGTQQGALVIFSLRQ